MNIVLTGFMGTGKSAVSRELSAKLGWKLIDTDNMIEKDSGYKISELFADKGEPYFREVETKAIKLVSLLDKTIISCGGGVVLKTENMEALEKNGFVVCLTAEPEVIYERVKNNKSRPLLNVSDPILKIKELLEMRARFYKRCHLSVDTSLLSVEQVAEMIIKREGERVKSEGKNQNLKNHPV